MVVVGFFGNFNAHLNYIVSANKAPYDKALTNLNAIDSSVDVNCIRAKYSKTPHIKVV